MNISNYMIIIEHDPELAKIMCTIFEQDHQCKVIGDIYEAEEVIQKHGVPTLILYDYSSEKRDQWRLIMRLRQELQCSLIILTPEDHRLFKNSKIIDGLLTFRSPELQDLVNRVGDIMKRGRLVTTSN